MWILFIALAVLLVLLVVFFVTFPFIRRSYIKKHFLEYVGKRVYNFANHNDLYLINCLLLKTMDGTKIDIDHLLCGNKYIYIISDQCIDGSLYAKLNNRTWVKTTKVKKQIEQTKIENLLLVNQKRIELFSQITGVDKSLIINIVVINDGCRLEGYEENAKNAFLIHISEFNKTINRFETENIKSIKDSSLKRAVKDIAKLNERNKDESKHS